MVSKENLLTLFKEYKSYPIFFLDYLILVVSNYTLLKNDDINKSFLEIDINDRKELLKIRRSRKKVYTIFSNTFPVQR